ncbi:hypothetical protein R3P38DRAFT_3245193 [Favolaschia claudopus]|uniref:Uncharacterized protein n=1 Tax=Favolaschia claudopus TaxID=2862362 RepID=A0AAV9Z136_9AGAR
MPGREREDDQKEDYGRENVGGEKGNGNVMTVEVDLLSPVHADSQKHSRTHDKNNDNTDFPCLSHPSTRAFSSTAVAHTKTLHRRSSINIISAVPKCTRAGHASDANRNSLLASQQGESIALVSVEGAGGGVLRSGSPVISPASASSSSTVAVVDTDRHYPIDNNPAFPGKRIFRNETGYFHSDDAKLRVWAVATAKGNADIDHCPVSTHFKKDQTLRVHNALPVAAAAVPQTPTQPAGNETVQLLLQALMGGGHAPYAFPPHPAFYAHQYPPPPPPPYGAYPPSHAHAPPPPPAAPAHPESIELPREISLDEFCTRYKMNEYTVYKQNLKNRL